MKKYLKIVGRINRIEFLLLTFIILMLEIITYLICNKDSVFLITTSFLFIIYLMQCAKRYHDFNMAAINGFVWWIIPFINIYFYFRLILTKGNEDINKYGNPSKFNITHLVLRKKESNVKMNKKDKNLSQNKTENKLIDPNVSCKKVKDQTENSSENATKIDEKEYKHIFIVNKYKRSFGIWFVDDGSFVKKGEEVYNYNDQEYNKLIHKAEIDGFIDIIEYDYNHSFKETKLLYYIRNQDNQRVIEKYKNIPKIIVDDFTESKNVIWSSVSSKTGRTYGVTSKSDSGLVNLIFTFNYLENLDNIIFHFNPKQIKPKKDDKILFLFENEKIIEYNLNTKPITIKNNYKENVLEYKTSIIKSELELFRNNNLKRWKIELVNDNRVILGGETGGKIEYSSKHNLIAVIKKFANDYITTIDENISDYKPIKSRKIEEEIEIIDGACHVYLMTDTTNNYYKIGISNKPYYREKTLQSEKPTIELIASKKYPVRKIAESIEKSLHSVYDKKRIRGEWFNLSENDVKNIIESLS
jgi:uncharacterized membrane protein YhaH (DUF805 family)